MALIILTFCFFATAAIIVLVYKTVNIFVFSDDPFDKEIETTNTDTIIRAYQLEQRSKAIKKDSNNNYMLNIVEDLNIETKKLKNEILSRKKIETDLQETNNRLQRSNNDLDEFAYIASHDLRSPLRAIDNLSTFILEDCEKILPKTSRNDLITLKGRVTKMDKLLDGLLHFSRVGRIHEEVKPIKWGAFIEDIYGLLDKPKNFKLRVQNKDLEFLGKTVPLSLVLRNLISNAITYRKFDEGYVEVNCEQAEDEFLITVQDNGRGIQSKFHDRVFALFKTLKKEPNEPSTSGLGLAIVKKIVETEGKTIQIDKAYVNGTKLYFGWPIEKSMGGIN